MSAVNLKKNILSNGFYIVFLAVVVIYSFGSEFFLTSNNLTGVLLDSSSLMIVGLGLTFVILTGSLDLSVGSVAFASAALGASLMQHDVSIPLALLCGLLFGAFIGSVNGVLVSVFGMNPMLTTLGMMIGLRGIALSLTSGRQIYIPKELKDAVNHDILGIPLLVMLALVLLVIAQLVLSRTIFGRHVIALGSDAKAAGKIGLPVKRMQFFVFLLSGTMAALGGMVAMINLGAVTPSLGKGMEFIAVAAVVLGGTSLFGGKGSFIPGTLMGVLMLIVIENGLNLMGASPYIYPFVRGLIIFVAMYADTYKNKMRLGSLH